MKNVNAEKKIIDKLVEECSENIDGNEIIFNETLNDYEKVCNSCTVYIVLLVIFFIISISLSSAFIYFHWYLKQVILILVILMLVLMEISNKLILKIVHIIF